MNSATIFRHTWPKNEKPAPDRDGSSFGASAGSPLPRGHLLGGVILCVSASGQDFEFSVAQIGNEPNPAAIRHFGALICGHSVDPLLRSLRDGVVRWAAAFSAILARCVRFGIAADFAAPAAQLDCCFVFHTSRKLPKRLGFVQKKENASAEFLGRGLLLFPRHIFNGAALAVETYAKAEGGVNLAPPANTETSREAGK